MTIGQRLKTAMDIKGISQKELAELVGTTEVTISRYVNDTRSIKIEYIIKICNALQISSDWLLGIKVKKNRNDIYDNKTLNKIRMSNEIIDIVKKYTED